MDRETELDQLRRDLSTIEAIRAGRDWTRKPDPTDPLAASRLAILDAVAPPVGKPTAAPYLRVIQGGKTD